MVATAYAKSDGGVPAVVQPLKAGLASPGEPLRDRPSSFDPADVIAAGQLQADWLNGAVGRQVAGGQLLAALIQPAQVTLSNLGRLGFDQR